VKRSTVFVRFDRTTRLDPKDLDLNKLRTFFAIAERGGVSAAAERLALTRSAVSHSLAALESSLGVALFHRVGKRLVLTREGTALRGAYRDMHERIAAALQEVGDESGEIRGWIRLGLYPGASRVRLAGVVERFLGDHPKARVRLVHASRADLQRRLLAGSLDFALSLQPTGAAARSRLRSTRLFEQSLVLAVSRGTRVGDDARKIASLPVIDYFRSDPLIDRWRAHHYGHRRLPRSNVVVWTGSGTDLALELTARGVGACVLPQDLVEPHRKRGELAVVRGARPTLREGIWLLEIDSAHTSPIQAAFKEALLL
jgi:DNA-binding transcriptional LysR family regulator